ncbi:MAG: DUF952 domain-containing protein [Chloroflexota bacterium]|nr:DUF952 domain-containing protein [Chloroflexota bacterium]
MIILHITPRASWQAAQTEGSYYADSLETEGFIHCSRPSQIVGVANEFYRGQSGLVLLVIAAERVAATVRYEDCYATGQQFPHIYGPLNLAAVLQVVEFLPQEDGIFELTALDLKDAPA